MIAKARFEKRPRYKPHLCRRCRVKRTEYRSPSTGGLKTDRAHDLCTECFWSLVRRANEGK